MLHTSMDGFVQFNYRLLTETSGNVTNFQRYAIQSHFNFLKSFFQSTK